MLVQELSEHPPFKVFGVGKYNVIKKNMCALYIIIFNSPLVKRA